MPSLPVARMSDRNRSRPDRLYLLAIIAYAMLAAGFIGYFIWRLVEG
jgi:hypothetical protein